MWYPTAGLSLQLTPVVGPGAGIPPSYLNPPPGSWQYFQPPLTKRDALDTSDVETVNGTSIDFETERDEEIDNSTINPHHFSSRIVGGIEANPNSVPWQVSLQLVEKAESGLCGDAKNLSSHFCGGSIIGERTILTASHCFFSS